MRRAPLSCLVSLRPGVPAIPTKAAPFYDKASTNIYYDISPLQYKGWNAYKAGVIEVLGQFQSFNLTLHDDADVHRSANTAWGTASWCGQGKLKNGNAVSIEGRWTCIWKKKRGKWLIVHEHLSVPWVPEAESRQH